MEKLTVLENACKIFVALVYNNVEFKYFWKKGNKKSLPALAVCMGKAASLCSTRRAESARPKWVSSWFPGWWSRLL